MASGTYISTNLTQSQMALMRLMDDHEIDIFSLDDVKKIAGDSFLNINEAIENLAQKNILSRIERGKYCRSNFRDEKAIGCFLVPDGAVAYWSALNLQGLTEQFPNTMFIQTTHTKSSKTVFGVAYRFVKIKSAKKVGVQNEGFGNHKYRITDLEKTIVDCFELPKYSGGYPELIRAIYQAKIDQDKLISYCDAIENISVVKRIAFLCELFEKSKMSRFLKYAEHQVNSRYVLLDPFGEDKGSFNNKWKLRLNITEEEIRNICSKPY